MKTVFATVCTILLAALCFAQDNRNPKPPARTNTPESLFQQARQLESAKGDYKGAIPLYERMIRENGSNTDWTAKALYAMGVSWEKIGNTSKARDCAQTLMRTCAAIVSAEPDMDLFVRKYQDDQPHEGTTPKLSQAKRQLMEKLSGIRIPDMEFREAAIADVTRYLAQLSETLDTNSPPNERGVNIILKLPQGPTDIPRITLSLKNINLLDAIKFITEVSGLKCRIAENAVIISSPNSADGELVTKTYRVVPNIAECFNGSANGSTSAIPPDVSASVKDFFTNVGVSFPEGALIEYRPNLNLLIAKNTIDNLNVVERIISTLNVAPVQIEIQVEQVKIQTDAAIPAPDISRGLTYTDFATIPTNRIQRHGPARIVTKSGANAEIKMTSNIHLTPIIQGTNDLANEATIEVGEILNATPVVGPDGFTIDLTMIWTSKKLEGWTNVIGMAHASPIISQKVVVQSVSIWTGSSRIIQIQGTDDAETAKSGERSYLIITATLVDLDGNRINKPKPGDRNLSSDLNALHNGNIF